MLTIHAYSFLRLDISISASKRIMGAAGVPLVPGYHGDEQDIDFMKLEADKIGYPILIKPTHGGGGKVCLLLRSTYFARRKTNLTSSLRVVQSNLVVYGQYY